MEVEQVTVATVTRGRPGALRNLLSSLARAGGVDLAKVVIVDDSSVEHDPREEFPSLPIDYVHVPSRLYISRAKNLALTRVASELVFFIDDDNLVPPDALAIITRDIGADRAIGALMPSVLYARRPDLVWVYSCPFRRDRWDFELVGRNHPRNPSLEGRFLPTDALPNASLFRTDPLLRVGGFQERLPVNSSAELCRRLKLEGLSVLADSRVLLFHDVEPPGCPGYWAQHAVDPDRVYHEVADWMLFRRALHPELRPSNWRFVYHSIPFLTGTALGLVLRGQRPLFPPIRAMASGYWRGLHDASLPSRLSSIRP